MSKKVFAGLGGKVRILPLFGALSAIILTEGLLMQKISKFGERLSDFMFFADNMTSGKLGGVLGFGRSTICQWRLGRRNPTLSNAVRLANYFGCSLDYLLGRSDDDSKFTPQPVMPFYERFISIINARRLSWYKVVKDTELSKSNIQDWRDGREPLFADPARPRKIS